MARLVDHLTLAVGAYALAYVLASIEAISEAPVPGPPWPVPVVAALFFLAAGFHLGRRLFGGRPGARRERR